MENIFDMHIFNENEDYKMINKVWPEDIAEKIYSYINSEQIPWKYGWKSNFHITDFGHWNYSFVDAKSSNSLDITDKLLETNTPVAEGWKYLNNTLFSNYVLIRCYVNGHTYGIEGYPHTDSQRPDDITLVTYMNKNWNRNYGGETILYYGNEIIHAELPKFNKGLVFAGKTFHGAKAVSRICPELRVTLMYKMGLKNADIKRDNLQKFITEIGAFNKKHANKKTLGEHLLNVYDLLKSKNIDDNVCLAGGSHSVFGTNVYKDSCLDVITERGKLEQIIGKEAALLSYIFYKIKRPQVLEKNIENFKGMLETNDNNYISVDEKQFQNLCFIEAANLADQKALNKYPKLHELWKKLPSNEEFKPTDYRKQYK